jgi:ABC-type multidrug transport system ATPase subunit
VEAGHASSDIVVLKNLAKRYPNGKVAVHPLTFSIPQGQCLGFLGVNGAGKTTTLKMLSLEHDPTGGEAFLNSFSILNQQTEVRRSLGYCPQFDALIPTLTARETLSLYARIKAVPEEMIAEYVTAMIQKLQLQAYADKPCGGYSGGNKRKLSVGIALIGDPSIVFLDEPSSGMDPDARRFMWKLISSTMAGRSVILTTHSMEECEALCGRIAIMAAGRLQCLGSSPHLKHRFGSGYQLDCNLAPARQAELAARVGGELKAVVKRQDGHKVTFGVPKGLLSLGKIFAMMESLKAEFELREYSLSETTLEQIFLQIAENNETREP